MDDLNAMAPALRPDEGVWPDGGITLTWHELRLLIALHLDQLGYTLGRVAPWDDARRTAQAMRDGETPLRVSEVVGVADPDAHPGLADDPTIDGINLGPRRHKPHDDDDDSGYLLTDDALARLPRFTRERKP